MKPELTVDNVKEYYPQVNGQHAKNREPYEAGDADAYYGRPRKPNYAYSGVIFNKAEMNSFEIAEYNRGFDENPSEKKEW